ncbi:MAG: ABC transporter ATP-binding protein [Thiohalocapsa sp.]|nr:ABC transporter ATP-binding protein [Thiohalocapsa sp.]MCF7990830.1 ABC transporter ATP-binding protein [Thiohalocapsa sp.]
MASIIIKNASVAFPIYDASSRSLKMRVLPGNMGGRIGGSGGHVSVVQALDDVSLTLNHGDRVGLVGHNGAGKTTLLRVLAGIYEPGAGSVRVDGHVAPLFDIALGMDPESTGYENIYLRGLFLGMSRREIRRRLPEIAEFTELGQFLDLPLRTYSAGMRMRLAFAVSTSITPDILLLDEGIGAGDAAFLDKANQRLGAFTDQAGIIVLASHADHLIKRMCTKAVLMERGRIVAVGQVDRILQRYRKRIAAA